jgi:glycerol-3-phosphate dehydrogenase
MSGPRISGKRRSLEGDHFQVVVIGGGINGVAIALQAARAGRRVLLLEQNDFGSGTTSRSTRIIHGGLRYLEHGELSFVRQSLRERQQLLCERRHLVHPLKFLLAFPRESATGRSALEIRLALWLYRKMAGSRLSADDSCADCARWERMLDQDRRWALFNYEDAQCAFPERLVAEWLVDAMAAGATVRNHTEALEIELRRGRVSAVLLRDAWTGEEARVSAEWVINAAGPWLDRVCGRSGIRTGDPLVGGVRGSHLVLERFADAPSSAVYTEASDGRPMFIVPWNGQLLVGTTEVCDSDDPSRTAPAEAEIAYLMDSVQRVFPNTPISSARLRYAFAGVRPLPFSPDKAARSITRKHILHDHSEDGAAGMISVIGGKLTTAALVARECVRKIGIDVSEPPAGTGAVVSSGEVEFSLREWARLVAAQVGTGEASARALAEWHGRHALCIAAMARTDPRLRRPLCEHTPHLVCEAKAAVQHEAAMTLADILLRRVPVSLGPCWSEPCSQTAARRIGESLGWNEKQIAIQRERFEQERARFLRRPVLGSAQFAPASPAA